MRAFLALLISLPTFAASLDSRVHQAIAPFHGTVYMYAKNLDTGQTKSFSIHLVAEREGMLDVIDQHYDQLERAMLEDFFTAA